MANGQMQNIFPTGDTSGRRGRILIDTVDADYSTATLIHQGTGVTVNDSAGDPVDGFVDYVTVDACNLSASPVTVIFWWTLDHPIYIDLPARGTGPFEFIVARPLTRSTELKATLLSPASANDADIGCRVDRFQQAL